MEEVLSLIFQGCNLAKELESSLPNLANQPEVLSRLCDEISRVFSTARERLSASVLHQDPSLFRAADALQQQQQQQSIDPSLQEWLRTASTSAMGLLHQAQLFAGMSALQNRAGGVDIAMSPGGPVVDLGGREVGQHLAMEASESGRGSSSSQRPRRRKDDAGRRTERVPAPRVGNTKIPPEDGFTWRKYGQKEILGSRFPRSYFRCTHQKLYNCSAKKQVQRLDNDPFTFEVTYRGEHTCHMSATAPSVPPPPQQAPVPPQQFTHELMTQAVTGAHHQPLARLLEFSLGGGGSGGGGAGPSTARYGKELDYAISDMADAMFNSGSSSTNSMEFIFHSMEDKGEPSDKKK
ncbi:hypothetical protein Tsubulata_032000 [Turnera subulata]|uniref:WRKY domain-containing protein n=1 Tax=Turnera subulata TaxID=218843 RepID=A0A9Q0JAX7_9ROSI|nr:hypothetical protein Tsubulata_032000 [Turnera subulata]